jgi:hypothetical protein
MRSRKTRHNWNTSTTAPTVAVVQLLREAIAPVAPSPPVPYLSAAGGAARRSAGGGGAGLARIFSVASCVGLFVEWCRRSTRVLPCALGSVAHLPSPEAGTIWWKQDGSAAVAIYTFPIDQPFGHFSGGPYYHLFYMLLHRVLTTLLMAFGGCVVINFC